MGDNSTDGPEAWQQARSGAVRGARDLFARHVVVGVLSLAGTSLLVRQVSTAEWASYNIAYFLIAFMEATFSATFLARVVRDQRPLQAALMRSAAAFMLATGIAGAGLLVLLSGPATAAYGQPSLEPFLLAVGVCAGVYALRALPVAVLERRLEYRTIAVAEVADQVTFYALSVPLVLGGHGYTGIALGLALRGVPSLLLLRRRMHVPLVGRWRRREGREILHFAAPSSGTALLVLANGFVPAVVLGGGNATELAYMLTAGTIVGYLATVQVVVQRVSFPSFAALTQGGARSAALAGTVRLSVACVGALLIPAGALAPLWLPVLLGDGWEQAAGPFTLIGGGLAVNSVVGVVSSQLLADGDARRPLRLQMLMTGSYVVLAVVAAPLDPLLGPSAAFLASRLLGALGCVLADRTAARPALLAATVGSVLATAAGLGGAVLVSDHPGWGCLAVLAAISAWLAAYRGPLRRGMRLARATDALPASVV